MPRHIEAAAGLKMAQVASDYVRPYKAVLHAQSRGFELFSEATLRHYAYYTDLLPKPKKVGRYAYYRLSDVDKLLEAL